MIAPSPTGELTLGHVLAATGLDLADIIIVRHTYRPLAFEANDLTPETILEFTCGQGLNNKLGKNPPFH